MYNVFVGAETGLLKGVNLTTDEWNNINSVSDIDRKHGIADLCCQCSGDKEKIVFSTRNGLVRSHQAGAITDLFQDDTIDENISVRNIHEFNNRIVLSTSDGCVRTWCTADKETLDHSFIKQSSFSTADNLIRSKQNPASKNQIATCGKEVPLKLWDLERPDKPLFTSKNVRNDWLDLRVPVADLDIGFLSDSTKIVTSTAFHQVRVYDPSTPQRRPVLDMEFDENPLTAMCSLPNNHQVIVGSSVGKMALLDLRKLGHLVQQYKGFAGGIRSISCHKFEPLVASCGADRFLRLHHISSKLLISKVYLKSRLNCLLLSSQPILTSRDSHRQEKEKAEAERKRRREDSDISENESGDDDELWSKMKVAGVRAEIAATRKEIKKLKKQTNT